MYCLDPIVPQHYGRIISESHYPITLYIEKVMYCKTENLAYVSFVTSSDG